MRKHTGPTLARLLKAADVAHAVFGGRKLSHAGKLYVFDAQTYFGVLEVESALDGRNLFETSYPTAGGCAHSESGA